MYVNITIKKSSSNSKVHLILIFNINTVFVLIYNHCAPV